MTKFNSKRLVAGLALAVTGASLLGFSANCEPTHAAASQAVKDTYNHVTTGKYAWKVTEQNENNYILYSGKKKVILPVIKGYRLSIVKTNDNHLMFGYVNDKTGKMKYIFTFNHHFEKNDLCTWTMRNQKLHLYKIVTSADWQSILGKMEKLVKAN